MVQQTKRFGSLLPFYHLIDSQNFHQLTVICIKEDFLDIYETIGKETQSLNNNGIRWRSSLNLQSVALNLWRYVCCKSVWEWVIQSLITNFLTTAQFLDCSIFQSSFFHSNIVYGKEEYLNASVYCICCNILCSTSIIQITGLWNKIRKAFLYTLNDL